MDQQKIGAFIAQLRHEAGLTQQALGRQLGVTNKTVSRWENGNYLPDVEMLQLLSGLFHVSINELLSGQRLDDRSLRDHADGNLVAAVKAAQFSLRERETFWKRKWLRDHLFLLLCCGAVFLAALTGVLLSPVSWLLGPCALGGLLLYMALRNRMMIYVEHKLYD